jgi:hypothetical protein
VFSKKDKKKTGMIVFLYTYALDAIELKIKPATYLN